MRIPGLPVHRGRILWLTAGLIGSAIVLPAHATIETGAQGATDGWRISRDAATAVNPIPLTPAHLTKGQELFKSKCQRCHGSTGIGNGPDADPEHSPGDLTDASRAARNPDGVLFDKIWNGRTTPKMPAFKTDISRADVWAIVHYIKTLRKP